MMKVSDFPIGARVKSTAKLDNLEIGTEGTVMTPSYPESDYVRVHIEDPEQMYSNGVPYFPDELELASGGGFVDYVGLTTVTNGKQTDLLPSDAKERKKIPLAGGVMDYFTSALIEVAKVSQAGNDQHNPGQPLHWARGKSMDQADTMMRHFVERGKIDLDGIRHSAKMVWRALAILQLELEAEGAPIARGAKE